MKPKTIKRDNGWLNLKGPLSILPAAMCDTVFYLVLPAFPYTGANGNSLGSTGSLTNLAGNGIAGMCM